MATIGNLITIARDVLQDNRDPAKAPYRHTNAKLVRYMNAALVDTKRLRPDLFLPDISTKEFYFTEDDLGKDFPLDYMYSMPFVEYMCGMVSIEEDEYVEDGRGAALLARFGAKLLTRTM